MSGKDRAYWVEILARHAAVYNNLIEQRDRQLSFPIRSLRGLPRRRRRFRAGLNKIARQHLLLKGLADRRILKVLRLIAYAKDRIAAIEGQTIFDRLRRGGLRI